MGLTAITVYKKLASMLVDKQEMNYSRCLYQEFMKAGLMLMPSNSFVPLVVAGVIQLSST